MRQCLVVLGAVLMSACTSSSARVTTWPPPVVLVGQNRRLQHARLARYTSGMEVGLWRSRRGDTHPHTDAGVDLDYWPQGTHAVTEEPALVLCATGGGGGAQQAMFRRDLDPLLARSLERSTA